MPEEVDDKNVLQVVTYAATVTPDPGAYDVMVVTLTGAITIANPTVNNVGGEIIMEFIQDATGGRVVTFGAAYKVNWTPTTTAGLRNVITVICDGTNWIQKSSSVGLPA